MNKSNFLYLILYKYHAIIYPDFRTFTRPKKEDISQIEQYQYENITSSLAIDLIIYVICIL